MAKPALGRGLGNLLGDTQIVGRPEPAPTEAEAAPPRAAGPGLGNLLTAGRNGGPAAIESPASIKPAAAQYVPLSVYKPPRPEPAPEPEPAPMANLPTEAPTAKRVRAPRWALVGADLLLMALATLLVFKSPVQLKLWELGLCLGAVALGGILACIALLTPPSGK